MKLFINRNFFSLVNRETQRFLALYKQTVMPGLISTALYILVFGKALGQRIDKNGQLGDIPYIIYIIPGLIMMAVINPAYQNSSSSIMQAKFLKFIDDILITPLSGTEIAFGYIIGGVLRGVITGFSIILMCFIIEPQSFYIDNYIATILYIVLVSWTFSAIGVIVGVFAKSWDHIGVFTTFIFMPLTMLGGVFWKVDWLPPVWSLISKFNPVYWMVSGLRQSMLGIDEASFGLSLIICSLFCLFFSGIASYLVSKGYRIKS
jgi:ABC-2 type transport system permease protein